MLRIKAAMKIDPNRDIQFFRRSFDCSRFGSVTRDRLLEDQQLRGLFQRACCKRTPTGCRRTEHNDVGLTACKLAELALDTRLRPCTPSLAQCFARLLARIDDGRERQAGRSEKTPDMALLRTI